MKNSTTNYSKPKQAILPLYISDFLDICDPVLVFNRFMEGINLEKYLKNVPKHITGRIRYNPANMLKAILFGFMSHGYISLRELEDNCKVNLRYMYLMDHQTPSYRTFGYFIENVLGPSAEELLNDINKKIFTEEHVDLSHLYIDGSKFEANANKYSWVWKRATEKFRYKLYEKITRLFHEMNEELAPFGIKIETHTEYVPAYLKEVIRRYTAICEIDESQFVHGIGHRKTPQQRHYERLKEYTAMSKRSQFVAPTATVIPRQTLRQPSCVSRKTIWAMTSFFLHIMSNLVLQMNTLLWLTSVNTVPTWIASSHCWKSFMKRMAFIPSTL